MCSAANEAALPMRRSFWRVLLPLCALLLLSLSACAGAAPVVKIGLVAPFEGRHRALGYDVIYSARLAVREINAAGGIGGYRVALVALDDGATAEFARETAASLVVDPDVVAVVGHWRPETTAVAAPVYDAGNLTFLPAGEPPLGPTDPAALPPDFVAAYEAITPFDETPGPYAAAAYEAFQQVRRVMETAVAASGEINRSTVRSAFSALQ